MRRILLVLILLFPFVSFAQDQKTVPEPTLRSILLEQLRSTHTHSEWFVCANTAVEGLTAEQANWTDGKGKPFRRPIGRASRLLEPAQPSAVQRGAAGEDGQ